MIKKDNFLTKLPVMEKFYTIQGEGYYSGQPFYFIRLGGCDVGCHWCDVKESWDHNQHQFIEVDDLIKDVKEYTSNVVITGGEPLMWDLSELTKRFKENNIKNRYKYFLNTKIKGLKTAVLVDRNHKKYPIKADFKGLSLSTSIQSKVEVVIDEKKIEAFLV